MRFCLLFLSRQRGSVWVGNASISMPELRTPGNIFPSQCCLRLASGDSIWKLTWSFFLHGHRGPLWVRRTSWIEAVWRSGGGAFYTFYSIPEWGYGGHHKKLMCVPSVIQSKHWKYAAHFIALFRLLFILKCIWSLMEWKSKPRSSSERFWNILHTRTHAHTLICAHKTHTNTHTHWHTCKID